MGVADGQSVFVSLQAEGTESAIPSSLTQHARSQARAAAKRYDLKPSTLNPQTQNPKPYTLNPKIRPRATRGHMRGQRPSGPVGEGGLGCKVLGCRV
jgi:hypothetical protein